MDFWLAIISAVVTGIITGAVTGIAAYAAIRVEVKYLRRDVDVLGSDFRAHITQHYPKEC